MNYLERLIKVLEHVNAMKPYEKELMSKVILEGVDRETIVNASTYVTINPDAPLPVRMLAGAVYAKDDKYGTLRQMIIDELKEAE